MSYGAGVTASPATRTEQVYYQPTTRPGARDTDRAIEVLSEHIDRAPSLLIAYAREHGVDDLTPASPARPSSAILTGPGRGQGRKLVVHGVSLGCRHVPAGHAGLRDRPRLPARQVSGHHRIMVIRRL